MTMPRVLGWVCAAMAWTSAAAAQGNDVALDYAAPAACPDVARLGDEISARLGYPVVSASSARTARVRIFVDGAEFSAVVEMGGGPARSVRSGDCSDLVATVGSMLATELDAGSVPPPNVPPPNVPPPSVPASAAAARARLRVIADEPELTLHELAGTSTAVVYGGGTSGYGVAMHYAPICIAPCEAEIAAGSHRLAVSRGTGDPWLVDGYTVVSGDAVLRIAYLSREPERIAGYITILSGLLVPIPFIAGGLALRDHFIDMDGYGDSQVSGAGWAVFSVGVGIGVAALVTGLYYLFRGDTTTVDVLPWTF